MKRILLYTLVGVGSYLIINKFFPEKPKPELNLRGTRVLKYLAKDKAVRFAVFSTFLTIIGAEFNQQLIDALIKCSRSLLACPGDKIRLSFKARKILRYSQYANLEEIKEILLDEALTTSDKLEFLKIKVQATLRNLRGIRRKYFILALLSLLIFLFGNNTVAFTTFWSSLRQLFGATPLSEDVDEYVIDWYREYNAPLPEELVRNIINNSHY